MQFAASPEWLPYDLTDQPEGLRFLKLDEEAFAAASFLDGRIVTPASQFKVLAWPDIDAEHAPSKRRHYIFHIGHVGSTLLARLIGAAPTAFSLREPAVLRAFAQRGGDGDEAQARARLRLIGDLLSRTFRPEQTAVIKATSFVSELGLSLMNARADGRAVLMAVAPHIYIASILGGPNSVIELKTMGDARIARLARRLDHPLDLGAANPGVLAAMSWLCEVATLAEIAIERPDACLWVDFEAFLQRPDEHLARVFAHLGLFIDEAAIRAAICGPLMSRYSKDTSHAYDGQTRRAVIEAAGREHGDDIRAGMTWLNRVGAGSAKARLLMQTAAMGLRG